ncbi:transposable element Tcb1 transposase [Trichonephila clavipes]|nr:transposable element Tcb1 transposase [Trichonephila clavipes]
MARTETQADTGRRMGERNVRCDFTPGWGLKTSLGMNAPPRVTRGIISKEVIIFCGNDIDSRESPMCALVSRNDTNIQSKFRRRNGSKLPGAKSIKRQKRSVMSRRKQRSAFDQVSEFDRGRIVTYGDCGLSFRKIGSRVGRNQTTVMWICDCWMQQGTMVRRVVYRIQLSAPLHHIVSVTHHSVSARTIRRHLHQSGLSARRPSLGLPLTQNHRRLRRQWCDERKMWEA